MDSFDFLTTNLTTKEAAMPLPYCAIWIMSGETLWDIRSSIRRMGE